MTQTSPRSTLVSWDDVCYNKHKYKSNKNTVLKIKTINNNHQIVGTAVLFVGKGRLVRLGLAFLVLGSICVPVLQEIATQQRYALSTSTIRLVGKTNSNLASKLSYDSENARWQFNKDGIKTPNSGAADPLAALRAQVGGAGKKDDSLYSVDLPTDGKKGVRYYDNNTDLSFSVVPEFSVIAGQARDGKLIYPISDDAKIIYTAKNNGMKEDIVLSHNIGNTLQFRYKLNLPDTLEAKILSDGSVGIYSADPTLFGDISFGTTADKEKIESARKTAAKDHLLFAIPAPVIKQTGSEQMKASAQFKLEGTELILYANNMDSVSYPASVDPSVIVTSTSDFTAGNNEDNIDFSAGQINRGGLTGGSAGSWNTTTAMANTRNNHATVVYNNYIYASGGTSPDTNNMVYAPVNSDGTLGAWAPTTSYATARNFASLVAYNGYMYVIGGTLFGSYYSDVQYAVINGDGTLGTWVSTTSLGFGRSSPSALAYNGYMYVIGGRHGTSDTQCNSTSTIACSDVQYAPINANGTLGTWLTSGNFDTARYAHATFAYNGYMYVLGGQFNALYYSDVQYAKINANGTVGSWSYIQSFNTGRANFSAVAYHGYVYIMAGSTSATTDTNDVQYAQINPNGTILGPWNTTASITNVRNGQTAVGYNGYLYVLGGTDSAGALYADVQYAKIDSAGVLSGYVTDSSSPATARAWSAGVAYNGYMYMVGGCSAVSADTCSTASTVVSYAPINIDGSLGTWANTTNALPAARGMGAVVADQGRLYYIGGRPTSTTVSPTVYYVGLNASTGNTTGAWTSIASPTGLTARYGHSAVVYNGYLYVIGGCTTASGACAAFLNDVEYAQLNSSGGFATNPSCANNFCPLTSFTTARRGHAAVLAGDKLYISGGTHAASDTLCNSTASTNCSDVQFATISSTGTLGAWTSTTSMPTGAYGHALFFDKGYLYTSSGKTGTAAFLNSTSFAKLSANGTVASDSGCGAAWCTTQQTPVARGASAYASFDGALLMVGGQTANTTAVTAAYSAATNNGGSGRIAFMSPFSSLPAVREGLKSVVYNGYIYVAGGYDGTSYATNVWYALLPTDGTVPTSWSSATSLPNAVTGFGFVANNGYLYFMGGEFGDNTVTNAVYYAQIGSNGALGAWTATNAMTGTTNGRMSFMTAVYNNYIYVIGGLDEDGLGYIYQSDVKYAPFNSNGTIGTWTGTSTAMPRFSGAAVVSNGYVYVMGGSLSGALNTAVATVQAAPINSDGTLGSWQYTTSLQTPRMNFDAVSYNGFIYAIGGINSPTVLTSIESAAVLPSGKVSSWVTAGNLSTANNKFAAVASGGYVYVIGGTNNTTRSQNIETGVLRSISHIGHYSKLIDMGSTISLSGFTYSGTVAGGASNILFRTAGTDGIFNTAASINSLSGSGTGLVCGTGGGGGGSRYVWLSVLLDDSQTGSAFADSIGTNNGNVSDITVNYAGGGQHPAPQVRLRGGKFFQTEALQPLDTCGP
jgi:hypothetical protein